MILGLYRWLSPLAAALLPLAAPFSPKLAATLRWRRQRRFTGEQRELLAGRRPRLWVHAASAGELEQARPLLAALRRRHPEAAILLSLGSASARRGAGKVAEADAVIPLPADTPRAMGELMAAFAPDALIFVKWDVWPNLLEQARRRDCPALLLGGVLGAESGRLRWPGRLAATPLHRQLARVGAASEADASRFRALGVAATRLSVTGDTRFDQVIARREEGWSLPIAIGDAGEGPCLVAGSTWPAEEGMLLAAFAGLRRDHPRLRLVLAPHEPSEAALDLLEDSARARGLPLWRLSQRPALADGGICVADRVGVLAELYALGSLSLVGGGFGKGVHSVLEPAARGLPVLMGPRIGRADEARRLVAAGGGMIFRSEAELASLWRRLLESPAELTEASRRALAFVETGSGAVARSLDLLEQVLPSQSLEPDT